MSLINTIETNSPNISDLACLSDGTYCWNTCYADQGINRINIMSLSIDFVSTPSYYQSYLSYYSGDDYIYSLSGNFDLDKFYLTKIDRDNLSYQYSSYISTQDEGILNPQSIAVDENYVWVAINGSAGIQGEIKNYNKSDLTPAGLIFQIGFRIIPFRMIYDNGFLWLMNNYYTQAQGTNYSVIKFNISDQTTSTFSLTPYGSPGGLTTNGTYVWVTIQFQDNPLSSTPGNTVIKLNYNNTYNSTITLQSASRPYGISHDDKYIWVSLYNSATIVKVDINNNNIISNIFLISDYYPNYNTVDDKFCWTVDYPPSSSGSPNLGKVLQILKKTNYKVSDGTDLIDIFAPLNGAILTPAPLTNYKVLYSTGMPSIDLNTIFAPYGGGIQVPTTNYSISNSSDLNTVFENISTIYLVSGNPTITSGTVNGTNYNNIITFNSSGSITFFVTNINVNYFLVGGGGVGGTGGASQSGSAYGGGGGAGQVRSDLLLSLYETYTVTIGGSATQSSIISLSFSDSASAGSNGTNANTSSGTWNGGTGGTSGSNFSGALGTPGQVGTPGHGGGGGGSSAAANGSTGGSGTIFNIAGVNKTYGSGGSGINSTGGSPNTGNGGGGGTPSSPSPGPGGSGGSGIAILYFN